MAEPPSGPPARTPNRRKASLSAPAASARLLLSPVRKKASKRWKMEASTGAASTRAATAASGWGATKIQARRPACTASRASKAISTPARIRPGRAAIAVRA
ncbi:hypothetical protein D3C80_790560 [compost metagenome]